ncbi:3-oxoadipyl-CoA thiolase [uncultured Shewanella sp.]|uniref:3-oxoadipyl-CoA thiolase n=1 Tax=uncultured Shewanella sp. TaxID=173975 RepID=UPI00260D5D61|nr:3-oxoadipyl-CoA thiolase [uncultured Shewanella sp.]
MLKDVYICDAIRTPIARYAGSLATIRADDLAAIPLKALKERYSSLDLNQVDDIILGCANQAGEDNRNIARMASLLADFPETLSAVTLNRLCGSGLNAIGYGMQAIKANEGELIIAGGVEHMTRAPYVMAKANMSFERHQTIFDTTMGWRFINPAFDSRFGTQSMAQTAENLAEKYHISREQQDHFAFASQLKAASAQEMGYFTEEIIPIRLQPKKGDSILYDTDEHLRLTSLEKMAKLSPIVHPQGSITAANASGINDGAAAMILASENALCAQNLTPKAKILGMSVVGVTPSLMGIGPVPASQKLLSRLGLTLNDMDIIELNEAFAAQALACINEMGLNVDDPRINPQGGAIALGHPLGMSGTRIVMSAMHQLIRNQQRYALCTMCIGVGQGIAMIIENVA